MILINNLALLDSDFLLELDQVKHKKVYAKIISLNWNEEPVSEITGNITTGNINVDGSSRVRRTCNITLITDQIQINELDWALRTKFYVYVGIENNINDNYEKIIWFPQGMYVITSFTSTLNLQGYTISIQGKDKMCLINGDLGGSLFAAHEFSMLWIEQENGLHVKEQIPIRTIIRQAVHQYAQEPYHNIIINDLDTCGVELLDYINNQFPLYIYEVYDNENITIDESGHYYTYTIDGDNIISTYSSGYPIFSSNVEIKMLYTADDANSSLAKIFDTACEEQETNWNLSPFFYNDKWYILQKKIQSTDVNSTVGYRATDLVYPEELTISAGGTIIEMLDKLVEMLGEFEYYYDLEGRFIFQRKKIYFNSSWSNAIINENQTYYDSTQNRSSIVYDFVNSYLVSSFQNKPNINAIKNDYIVWGQGKTTSDTTMPIHLRYAIDKKPKTYYSLTDQKPYISDDAGGLYDWRELIYQMARDNLSSETKIMGLQASLKTLNDLNLAEQMNNQEDIDKYKSLVRYHYDYKLIPAEEHLNCYRYDMTSKKFLLVESEDDYNRYIENNEFLYGANQEYQKIELSPELLQEFKEEVGYDYCYALKHVRTYLNEDIVPIDKGIEIFTNFLTHLQELYYGSDIIVSALEDQLYPVADFIPADIDKTSIVYETISLLFQQYNGFFETSWYYDEENDINYFKVRNQNITDVHIRRVLKTSIREMKAFIFFLTNLFTENDYLQAVENSKEKEAAFIKKVKEKGYLNITLNELDAWQNTFNTGYDAYYTDMLEFWPRLYRTNETMKVIYNPDGTVSVDENGRLIIRNEIEQNHDAWVQNGFWNPDYFVWFQAQEQEWFEFKGTLEEALKKGGYLKIDNQQYRLITREDALAMDSLITYYISDDAVERHVEIKEPELLTFWLDFLDDEIFEGELYPYSVNAIGRRTKVVNDDKVKAIYFREVPQLLLVSEEWESVPGEENLSYTRINLVPPVKNYFKNSSQGKSAKEVLDSLIYDGTYYQEQITLQLIPIYYLEPNTRIAVHDDQNGINGEYLIKSYSIQLSANGTMSITANRAVDRII